MRYTSQWMGAEDRIPEPVEKHYNRGPCGKKIYSERDAGQIVNLCKHHNRRTNKGYSPKRKYYCQRCNGWHVTHYKNEYRR